MPDNECILCGAPGGYPYCNEACREADNPEECDAARTISAADFGPLTDITDPWASDARNHL
jgi:Na+-translocating ferredoxin:NAD+ oxidoreductase RNF subunit RnfB